MPTHRYVEENSLAAMLATKRSAGVTPEVNRGMCNTPTSPPSMNKAAHSGFETQRRHHQKSKTGQGSHSDWKTWGNGKTFSSQGKVREF